MQPREHNEQNSNAPYHKISYFVHNIVHHLRKKNTKTTPHETGQQTRPCIATSHNNHKKKKQNIINITSIDPKSKPNPCLSLEVLQPLQGLRRHPLDRHVLLLAPLVNLHLALVHLRRRLRASAASKTTTEPSFKRKEREPATAVTEGLELRFYNVIKQK